MDNNTTDDKSTVIQYLTYALPTMIMGFLLYPVQLLLAGMYAKHFGLLLTTIASVVFVARLFDAVTDPLIGYLSDRYCIRKGTRKPWVIIGCLGTVISGYYLFTPPDNVSVGYFLCWYMAFYLAFTVFEIPHMTWGGELAISSHQKNRIYSLRSAFLFLGLLMYAAMPLLPIFEGEGFTPQTLRWSALISAVLIIPALVICVRYTPDGRSISPGKMKKDSPRLVLKAIIENRPLLILLAGLFFIAIADGMYLGLTFIFVDSYLGHGEKLPLIFTISLVLGLMATGAMYLLSARVEKVKLYTLAVIASIFSLAATAFLEPNEDALVRFIVLTSIFTFCNAAINVIVPSMMADIADYGTWKFRENRGATYFSSYSLMLKTCVGLGVALGLGVAGLFNFDSTTTTHTVENIFGLRLAFAYIPALLMLVSLPLVVKNPINARRHGIVQHQLEQRMQRNQKSTDKNGLISIDKEDCVSLEAS